VAGMAAPRELVQQHRGGIPMHVGVVAQSRGVRALNARTCEQERGVVRAGTSSEADLARGGVQPSSDPRGRSAGPRGPLWS
jgi:hypothetical protein